MIIQVAEELGTSPAGLKINSKYIMEGRTAPITASGLVSGGFNYYEILGVMPTPGTLSDCQFTIGNQGTTSSSITLLKLASGGLINAGTAMTSIWNGALQTSNCMSKATLVSGSLQVVRGDRIITWTKTGASETLSYPTARAEFRI